MSFNEQRELEALPEQIEALESEQVALHEQMADPAFYQQNGEGVAAAQACLEQVESALQKAYARWEELGESAEAQSRSATLVPYYRHLTGRTTHPCRIARADLQVIGSLVQIPHKEACTQRPLFCPVYLH